MTRRIFAFITAVVLMLSSVAFAEELPPEDHSAVVEEVQQAVEAPAEETMSAVEEQPREIPAEPAEEPSEEDMPAEPAEEPSEEEVPAEPAEELSEEDMSEEPAEELSEEEVPEEPAEEPSEEEVSEEPANEPVGEEPAEEPAEEEEFEDEPDDTAVHFSRGYVRVKSETKVFKSVYGGDTYGVLANAGNVYAVIYKEDENPDKDWIELLFEYDGNICRGYVKFAQVKVLDDDDVERLVDAAHDSPSTVWSGNIVVMPLRFVVPEAEMPEEIPAEPAGEPVEEEQPAEPAGEIAAEETTAGSVQESAEDELPDVSGEESAEEEISVGIVAESAEEQVSAEPVEEYSGNEYQAEPDEDITEEEIPVVPAEESAAEDIPAEPADEVTDEESSDELFEVEISDDEATEEAAEEEAPYFSSGYVQLKSGTKFFMTVGGGEAYEANVSTAAGQGIVITSQPVNFEGDVGDTASFNVVAAGTGLTYQWKYRLKGKTAWTNAGMDGSTTATMSGKVDSTRIKNEYCCVITDAAGNTVQTNVICIVKPGAALAITTQPVNFEGDVGDTVAFSVVAAGTGLTYQWKYRLKGKTAWTNAGMDGSTTATMSGKADSNRIKNEYCCFITDAAGNTVQTDIVSIVKPAAAVVITSQPVNFEGDIGDTASFSVVADGTGLTYQWKYRLKGKTAWTNAGMDGSTTATMSGKVDSTRIKNEYCCFITDAAGNTVQTDIVSIVKPAATITITTQPVNFEGDIGDTVSFSVVAAGAGLTYQWKYRLKGKTAWTNAGMDGSTTATMSGKVDSTRIKNEYCCFITDASGSTVQTDIVCIVKSGAVLTITTQPQNYVGAIGDKASFTVEASGAGLTYQWKYRAKGKTAWANAGMDGSTTASMSGEMTAARVKNEYCCVIKDAAGNTVQTVVVCMQAAADPLKIVTQPVNFVGNIGDTAVFSVEASGTGLTYQWKYRAKGSTAWANAGMTGKTTAKMSGEVTAARLGYEYCCVIKDAAGNTVQTDAVCMQAAADPLKIVTQPVNFVGNIGDTAVFSVEASGTGLTYQWKYRAKGSTAWANAGMTGKTTAKMTGEMTETRLGYEYCCVIKDASGNTVQTDAVCMQAAADPFEIVTQPENFVGCVGDTAEFRLEATGTGLTYQWFYHTKGNTGWSRVSSTEPVFSVVINATSLKREYYCQVKDSSGKKLSSATVSIIAKTRVAFTTDLSDIVVLTNEDAVFSVAATGDELTYLWQTKAPGADAWADTDCTGDTFTVAAADCVNGMAVQCVVTDKYGESVTSATAAVTVLAAEITECVVSAENEVQLTVDCSVTGVEFRVIEVLDEEETLVKTSSETVITLQNVTLGEHTYYVSVYYEGEDLIDTEPVSILCDKAKANDVLYTLGEDNKLTVTGYTGTASSLVIPETVDGFTVTAVGASAFEGNTALQEIDLPDTIASIGSRAFKNCSSLSSMH